MLLKFFNFENTLFSQMRQNAGEAKDAYLFFMERAPDYVAD